MVRARSHQYRYGAGQQRSRSPGSGLSLAREPSDTMNRLATAIPAIKLRKKSLPSKSLSLCAEDVQLGKENCGLKKTVKALQLQICR